MRIEGDAVTLPPRHVRQRALADFDRCAAQVGANKLDQIERTEYSGAVMLPVAEQVKDRQPSSINNDRFAVDET